MDHLTEAELGYLAGLIDGEGCINISRIKSRYYVLQVITAQTNEYILNYWQQKTGLGTIHKMKPGRNPNASTTWHWHCGGDNAEKLLKAIEPYLVLKKEEARVALEFLKVCDSQQSQFRGRHAPRLTADMLKVREVYKNALHALKFQRSGAELDQTLEVEYEIPPSSQLSLFHLKAD